jgi:general secretion pathway protein D
VKRHSPATDFLPRSHGRPLARITLALVLLLGGCAAQEEHRNALGLLALGKTTEGLDGLRRASTLDPENVNYRIEYLNQRDAAVRKLLDAAEDERQGGRPEMSAQRLREVLKLDPGNDRARLAVQALDLERRSAQSLLSVERLLQANQIDAAAEQLQRVLKDHPRDGRALELQRTLDERLETDRQAREEKLAARAAFKRPVTLQFRDAPLRMVFEAVAKVGNINVIVDRDVKNDLRTTIFVKDASIEDALDVILLQNQLEKRVLNSNTLLIFPSNPTKLKELSELKVRSFQISNIDVAFMANILKTMVKTKDIVTDTKTNILVMRDTPEAIALAERLIAANDLPDAEVMLEVEVLEISSTRTSELGLKLPTSLTLSVPTPASGSLTVGGLRGIARNDLLVSPLQATLNMMLQDGDANVLASPRIRSRNKEKAKILVGDKLPIITNLISPQQAGQSSVVTGSIQYVEVGIKLEVEPQIYADGDVGIKLNLEVSNVTDTIQTDSGRAYQIGTRSAQSTLRLHDGETQVMAGLINDTDRTSALKIPGVGQLPVLGRLFSNNSDNARKSEIVLSITPRIIRPQAMPNMRNADAWSGTESSIRDRQLRIEPLTVLKASTPKAEPAAAAGARVPAPVAAPVAAPVPVPAPAPATAAPPAAPAEAGTASPDGAPPATTTGAAASDPTTATPAAATDSAAAAAAAAPAGPPTATANGFPIVPPRPLPMRSTSPQPSGASPQ